MYGLSVLLVAAGPLHQNILASTSDEQQLTRAMVWLSFCVSVAVAFCIAPLSDPPLH